MDGFAEAEVEDSATVGSEAEDGRREASLEGPAIDNDASLSVVAVTPVDCTVVPRGCIGGGCRGAEVKAASTALISSESNLRNNSSLSPASVQNDRKRLMIWL